MVIRHGGDHALITTYNPLMLRGDKQAGRLEIECERPMEGASEGGREGGGGGNLTGRERERESRRDKCTYNRFLL